MCQYHCGVRNDFFENLNLTEIIKNLFIFINIYKSDGFINQFQIYKPGRHLKLDGLVSKLHRFLKVCFVLGTSAALDSGESK